MDQIEEPVLQELHVKLSDDSFIPIKKSDTTIQEECQVLILITHLEVRELQRKLFPLNSPSTMKFLRLDLLSSLPDLIHVPEEVHDRLDKIRDITYTVVGYERLHRRAKDLTQVMIKTMMTAVRKRHSVILDVLLHSFGGNLFYTVKGGGNSYSDRSWKEKPKGIEFSSLEKQGDDASLFDVLTGIVAEMEDHEDNSVMTDIISKYFPGVWSAVKTGNIEELRRLINYWCFIDIYDESGNVSLIKMAHETGNDQVIRLVSGGHYTLLLIHMMFSGNVYCMKELLSKHADQIQLDFKHMTDFGAPILYYVIHSGDTDMACLLMRYGCKIYTHMMVQADKDKDDNIKPSYDDLEEVPVFYAALTKKDLHPKMMKALLCPFDDEEDNDLGNQVNGSYFDLTQDLLYRMTFKGKNCLQVALDSRLNIDSFKILVEVAGGRVISDRNESCLTVRDVADSLGLFEYVEVIDSHVVKCFLEPEKYPHERQILALYGYDKSNLDFPEGSSEESFLRLYDEYQSQIRRLSRSVDDGNLDEFIRLSEYHPHDSEDEGLFEKHLSWESRTGRDNPLPLLHRAVVFNRRNIVQAILEKKPFGHSIDTLLDHTRRTALHYAYALSEFRDIRDLLREYGCSDHTLDLVCFLFS